MLCPEIKNYIITNHAYLEMKRRGITEKNISDVLLSPGQREEVRLGRCVYQSVLTFGDSDKIYLMRVFVDIDRTPAEVVTVYFTSNIKKYWR